MSQLAKLLITSAVVIGLLIAARFATASHGSSAGFIISLLGLGVAAIAFAPEAWSSIIGIFDASAAPSAEDDRDWSAALVIGVPVALLLCGLGFVAIRSLGMF